LEKLQNFSNFAEKPLDGMYLWMYNGGKSVTEVLTVSPKDERINIRLTASERELLQKSAERAGYSNISAYIRAVTIGDEQGILQEIREDIKTLLKKIDNEE